MNDQFKLGRIQRAAKAADYCIEALRLIPMFEENATARKPFELELDSALEELKELLK